MPTIVSQVSQRVCGVESLHSIFAPEALGMLSTIESTASIRFSQPVTFASQIAEMTGFTLTLVAPFMGMLRADGCNPPVSAE